MLYSQTWVLRCWSYWTPYGFWNNRYPVENGAIDSTMRFDGTVTDRRWISERVMICTEGFFQTRTSQYIVQVRFIKGVKYPLNLAGICSLKCYAWHIQSWQSGMLGLHALYVTFHNPVFMRHPLINLINENLRFTFLIIIPDQWYWLCKMTLLPL